MTVLRLCICHAREVVVGMFRGVSMCRACLQAHLRYEERLREPEHRRIEMERHSRGVLRAD